MRISRRIWTRRARNSTGIHRGDAEKKRQRGTFSNPFFYSSLLRALRVSALNLFFVFQPPPRLRHRPVPVRVRLDEWPIKLRPPCSKVAPSRRLLHLLGR